MNTTLFDNEVCWIRPIRARQVDTLLGQLINLEITVEFCISIKIIILVLGVCLEFVQALDIVMCPLIEHVKTVSA